MAYGTYGAPVAASNPPAAEMEERRIGRIVNAAGAVLSISLLAGVGLWSYRLMVRDVSGIPVIQALDGPMRVSPADPGGRQTAFQGLAVNAIASGGAASAPRQIALAPQATGIAPEDVITTPQPVRPGSGHVPGPALESAPDPAPGPAPAAAAETGAAALPDAAARETATETEELVLVPLGTPGIQRSPIPPRRSERIAALAASAPQPLPGHVAGTTDNLAEAALQEIASRLGGARVTEIDPTSLTAGTRLVQLGAYETEGEARAAWDELASRFPGYLDGRARVVEAATAGGRIFFRLRAHGFAGEPEARRFCSVFLAEDVDCTPVLIR